MVKWPQWVWAAVLLITPVGALDAQAPMVFIPAGEFIMGVSHTDKTKVLSFGWEKDWRRRIVQLIESASPEKTVNVDDFFIDRYEVTNQGYFAYVMQTGHRLPSMWRSHKHLSEPDQPVVGVSWGDARGYCDWAAKRLPTEVEWEKAARGVDGRNYPWGNGWDPTRLHSADALAGEELADFTRWNAWRERSRDDDSLRRPAPVGSHPDGASPYGVEDMAGNVWEWVDGWFDASQTRKVLRGGAFDVPRIVATTWFRENFLPPQSRVSSVTGFRCARSAYGQIVGRYPAPIRFR